MNVHIHTYVAESINTNWLQDVLAMQFANYLYTKTAFYTIYLYIFVSEGLHTWLKRPAISYWLTLLLHTRTYMCIKINLLVKKYSKDLHTYVLTIAKIGGTVHHTHTHPTHQNTYTYTPSHQHIDTQHIHSNTSNKHYMKKHTCHKQNPHTDNTPKSMRDNREGLLMQYGCQGEGKGLAGLQDSYWLECGRLLGQV